MTARRRSRVRRRKLDDYAERSPVHAAAAGVIRFGLRMALTIIVILIVVIVLLPSMADSLADNFREQMQP